MSTTIKRIVIVLILTIILQSFADNPHRGIATCDSEDPGSQATFIYHPS